MKYLSALSLFLLLSTSFSQQHKYFQIDKNTRGDFNIYSSQGELLFEYNSKSCDSLTLKTLDNIYSEADSWNDKVTKIEIMNLPEKTIFESPIVTVLIGVLFGWLFSHYSQKRLIREQFKLQQDKDWLNDFIEFNSELKAVLDAFEFMAFKILKEDTPLVEKKKFIYSTEFINLYRDTIQKGSRVEEFLNDKNPTENKLLELYRNLTDLYKNAIYTSDMDSVKETLSKLSDEIDETILAIIKEKRNSIKNL